MKLTFKVDSPYKGFAEDVQKGRRISGGEFCFIALGLALVIPGTLYLNGINPLHASGSGWAAIVFGLLCSALPGIRVGTRFFVRRLIAEDQLNDRLNHEPI